MDKDYKVTPVILTMAKAIQRIEHQNWHSWESCTEEARQRALRQAIECYYIVINSQDKQEDTNSAFSEIGSSVLESKKQSLFDTMFSPQLCKNITEYRGKYGFFKHKSNSWK